MTASVFHSASAFEPFYSDTVAVRSAAQSGTFAACVFEDGLDDPISDATSTADRRRIAVHVPKSGDGGWNCATMPKIGDTVTVLSWGGIEGTDEFAVFRVVDFADSWILECKEVAR